MKCRNNCRLCKIQDQCNNTTPLHKETYTEYAKLHTSNLTTDYIKLKEYLEDKGLEEGKDYILLYYTGYFCFGLHTTICNYQIINEILRLFKIPNDKYKDVDLLSLSNWIVWHEFVIVQFPLDIIPVSIQTTLI